MKIDAKSTSLENDGACTILAFADDPIDPHQYVILQVTNNPSEQDIKLGQDGVHLELGGQQVRGYDLIIAIEPSADGVLISLNEDTAKKAGIGCKVAIAVEGGLEGNLALSNAIKLFQARL